MKRGLKDETDNPQFYAKYSGLDEKRIERIKLHTVHYISIEAVSMKRGLKGMVGTGWHLAQHVVGLDEKRIERLLIR